MSDIYLRSIEPIISSSGYGDSQYKPILVINGKLMTIDQFRSTKASLKKGLIGIRYGRKRKPESSE